ncbi:MAG: HD domain-containing protein [Anaeroplasmataceae bacterium]|nr:HD domain-containing protein [Anaeroplasmataceae bacterium]
MMQIIGKVLTMNTSDGMLNLQVADEQQKNWNIKASLDYHFLIGYVYIFEISQTNKERLSYIVESYQSVEDLSLEESDQILRKFFPEAPLSLKEEQSYIQSVLDHMENKVIKDITETLLKENEKKYFLYPAASRMHHTYVGGLAYHCIGMLKLAETFLKNYPYLKADYLYAGILLHDLGKTSELSGVQATEYTVEGQLLGHLVIGALEVGKKAAILGYGNCPEVKMLEHMLISHHGQPQFGAAKRPMTPEAIALWYIDTIDSKFRVLGEELNKTESNHFTDTIGVLDKIKIYKE